MGLRGWWGWLAAGLATLWFTAAPAEAKSPGTRYQIELEGVAISPVTPTGNKWDIDAGDASPAAKAIASEARRLFEQKALEYLDSTVGANPLIAVGLYFAKKAITKMRAPDAAAYLIVNDVLVMGAPTKHDTLLPVWKERSYPQHLNVGSNIVIKVLDVDVAHNDDIGQCGVTLTAEHLKAERAALSCSKSVIGAVIRLHKYTPKPNATGLRVASVLIAASRLNGQVHWDINEGRPDLLVEVRSGTKFVLCPVIKNSSAVACSLPETLLVADDNKVQVRVWDSDAVFSDWVGKVDFTVKEFVPLREISMRRRNVQSIDIAQLQLLLE